MRRESSSAGRAFTVRRPLLPSLYSEDELDGVAGLTILMTAPT